MRLLLEAAQNLSAPEFWRRVIDFPQSILVKYAHQNVRPEGRKKARMKLQWKVVVKPNVVVRAFGCFSSCEAMRNG